MKTPHTGKAKNAPLNRCSECKPPGGLYVENFLFFIFYFFIYLFICFFCTWKIALKYKVKQSKNGKCSSNYNASPIDFETQISLRRKAPRKGPLKNVSPRAYFCNFMVVIIIKILIIIILVMTVMVIVMVIVMIIS